MGNISASSRAASKRTAADAAKQGEPPGSDPGLPELRDRSRILSDAQARALQSALPGRLQCEPWRLTYSTDVHGCSMSTMYRLMETSVEGPVLVVVRDFQGGVFGALTSDPPLIQPHWFGRCESFLFTFVDSSSSSSSSSLLSPSTQATSPAVSAGASKAPPLRVFGPTFANENCIFAGPHLLMFGGSTSGLSGLQLGEDFCEGCSFACDTYTNPGPLASSDTFLIRSVEMWTFFEKS